MKLNFTLKRYRYELILGLFHCEGTAFHLRKIGDEPYIRSHSLGYGSILSLIQIIVNVALYEMGEKLPE